MDKIAVDTARGAMNMAGEARREKCWAEMSIEEKIERLRRVLQQTFHAVEQAGESAGQALQLVEEHAHLDGKVMKAARLDYALGRNQVRGGRNYDPLA